jgi:archaeal flagellar protein FlaD
MVEGEEESKAQDTFDFSTELSTLVSKNVIPSKLAEKLDNKLKEKKVKITEKQFNSLIEKIQDILRSYAKNGKPIEKKDTIKKETPQTPKNNEDMQKIINTVEELKEKISYLEKENSSGPKIVTTDDIKVPKIITGNESSWNVDPLTEIPNNPESVIILMKWLQYLIDKCGRPNLNNILDYYVDIGWISDEAKMNIIDYSQGITEKVKKEETTKKQITDLPSKDHIQSLIYIQKLKGMQFDKHFIERIENELSRISKKIDNS